MPLDCGATDTVWPMARSPMTNGSAAPRFADKTFGCSPPTLVVGLLAAPKSTSEVACCASSPQSSAPTSVFTTYWMIVPPPGEPVPITKSPLVPSAAILKTSVGAIELRGRLPGWTRFAIGAPVLSVGVAEKSVSWLLRMKPRVMWYEPKPLSTVVVITSALPFLSTIVMWVVPLSGVRSTPSGTAPRLPATAVPMLVEKLSRSARPRR